MLDASAQGLLVKQVFGDQITMYSASIALTGGVQDYDLQVAVADQQAGSKWDNLVQNKRVNIHRVYYQSPATMWRFFGYFGGWGTYGNLSTYGMYADDSTFQLVPAWQNKLQAMQFETDLYTRTSHYSYEIWNNRLKIYPPPSGPGCGGSPSHMWFLFSIPDDAWVEDPDRKDGVDGINNMNTLPFANLPYDSINSMGKQWIRKYALAISKEMLGQIRGKFGNDSYSW